MTDIIEFLAARGEAKPHREPFSARIQVELDRARGQFERIERLRALEIEIRVERARGEGFWTGLAFGAGVLGLAVVFVALTGLG